MLYRTVPLRLSRLGHGRTLCLNIACRPRSGSIERSRYARSARPGRTAGFRNAPVHLQAGALLWQPAFGRATRVNRDQSRVGPRCAGLQGQLVGCADGLGLVSHEVAEQTDHILDAGLLKPDPIVRRKVAQPDDAAVAVQLAGVLRGVEGPADVRGLYVPYHEAIAEDGQVGSAALDPLRLVDRFDVMSERLKEGLQRRPVGVLGGVASGELLLESFQIRLDGCDIDRGLTSRRSQRAELDLSKKTASAT